MRNEKKKFQVVKGGNTFKVGLPAAEFAVYHHYKQRTGNPDFAGRKCLVVDIMEVGGKFESEHGSLTVERLA